MRTRFVALSAGFIIFLVSTCVAQQVTGYSDIYYDDSSGQVIARCETHLDYDVAAYYRASVECTIQDAYGYEVAYDVAYDDSYWGMVDVSISATAEPGMLYEAWGYHDGHTYIHEAGLYPDQWTDYYNFLSLDPNIWPDWGNDPWYFSLLGPGPPMGAGDPYIQFATTYDDAFAPPCPSSVSISSRRTYSLSSYFPEFLTGVGIVADMSVSPDGPDRDGVEVTESFKLQSNSCPSNIPTCEGLSGQTFTIGTGGTTAWHVNLLSQRNVFYDQHATLGNYSMLQPADPNSCSYTCTQTYSCGGVTLNGSFTVTHTFSKSVIGSTRVTNVTVSKQ